MQVYGAVAFLLLCLATMSHGQFSSTCPPPRPYVKGFYPPCDSFSPGDLNNFLGDFLGWGSSGGAYYYEEVSSDKARIKWGGGGARGNGLPDADLTVSEGMGYGMLMAVQSNQKSKFDKLLNFYESNVRKEAGRRGIPGTRILSPWIVWANGDPFQDNLPGFGGPAGGRYAAPDGDMDVAMALLMANKKWGSASYLNIARGIIKVLHDQYLKQCNGRCAVKPFDDPNWACTRGGPINLSYHMSAYFRVFAKVPGAPNAGDRWNKAANDAYHFLNLRRTTNGMTIVSDWMTATGGRSPDGRVFDYCFDASRIPWRVALDYLWRSRPEASAWMKKIMDELLSTNIGGISKVKGCVDGVTGFNKDKFVGLSFLGGFAAGAMAYPSDPSVVKGFSLVFKNAVYSKRPSNRLEGGRNDLNDYYGLATSVLYGLTLNGYFPPPRF